VNYLGYNALHRRCMHRDGTAPFAPAAPKTPKTSAVPRAAVTPQPETQTAAGRQQQHHQGGNTQPEVRDRRFGLRSSYNSPPPPCPTGRPTPRPPRTRPHWPGTSVAAPPGSADLAADPRSLRHVRWCTGPSVPSAPVSPPLTQPASRLSSLLQILRRRSWSRAPASPGALCPLIILPSGCRQTRAGEV